MTFVIVFLVIVFIIFVPFVKPDQVTREIALLKEKGLPLDKMIFSEKYVYGHPAIDVPTEPTYMDIKDGEITIYQFSAGVVGSSHSPRSLDKILKALGTIPVNAIEDITIEDATQIEHRVTVGRLLVTGIFAFALKKQKKHELLYLIIKWKQGKFSHETFFEFTGLGSAQKANQARNILIRAVS